MIVETKRKYKEAMEVKKRRCKWGEGYRSFGISVCSILFKKKEKLNGN